MRRLRRVAVVTSGGDAPGMNAAIRAVTRTASAQGIHTLGVLGAMLASWRGASSRALRLRMAIISL